jgi:type IV secretory pathway protease TraF
MVRFAPLGAAFIGCAALAIVPLTRSNPLIVWNASNSVPIGLYLIERRPPRVNEIAVLQPPEWASTMAHQRGYLPTSVLLLKPVVARYGGLVCRFGRFVFVNGYLRALALRHDKMRRPLPSWRGCSRLGGGQIFVVSKHKDSFDSRYFGAVDARTALGVGRLILSPSK